MKKTHKIILVLCIISLISYLGYGVITKINHKNQVEDTLQTMPIFSFKTLRGKDFRNTDLKPHTPTVFIYFNSDCDFCQHEAQNISEHVSEFDSTQLLFVSSEDTETIKMFAQKYELLNKQNITFLNDNTHSFSNRFDAKSIPFTLIYNDNKELLTKHNGLLKANTILKALQ